MELGRFCSTARVVIVAGKGGVGKTTVTATLAVTAARAGMSVLIIEVEGKSGLSAAFGRPALTYDEIELAARVRARTLTPDEALVDYLDTAGLKRISKRLAHSGALDVVATAVPGMKDILVLGKVKQLEQAGAADLILIDAPAAGHAITFLMSPIGLLDAVRVGPVRKQATDVVAMLSDPARCQVLLVTIPEETPVNELVDTAYALEDKIGVKLGPVVVNACYPESTLCSSVETIRRDADLLDVFVSPREARDLARASSFRAARHELQVEQADRLASLLPLHQIKLPFLFTADVGPAELETLADAFERGVATLPEDRR
ncbi:MAG: ArsA-related P-loop ATPase [Acidimicrobiia bacterium]